MSGHYSFVSRSSPRISATQISRLTFASDVLHCDKVSCFCHIEASTVRSALQALIVSGDNGLSGTVAVDEINKRQAIKFSLAKWGTFEGMSENRKKSVLAVGVLLLAALALAGCSISIADLPLVGTPADAPGRPKEAGAYLPVHDLPPDREEAAIPPAEQVKIESELVAARDRQASAAAKNPTSK
jgi:hypothetical protein